MFRHNLLRKLTSSVVFPTAEFYAPLCNWLTTENVIFEWSCKNTTHKILNRHILTNVHLFNFPFHSLWRLHFFGKYICTKAFKHTYSIIYNAYTMQIDFPYMVKKIVGHFEIELSSENGGCLGLFTLSPNDSAD